MFELFIKYQIVKADIFIRKKVSDDNNLKIKYNYYDEIPPSIAISYKYNKIQKKNLR